MFKVRHFLSEKGAVQKAVGTPGQLKTVSLFRLIYFIIIVTANYFYEKIYIVDNPKVELYSR